MCSPENLRILVAKYHKDPTSLDSAELRTLVEGLDSFIKEGENQGAGVEGAAAYFLSRVASRIESMQEDIRSYSERRRKNFEAIAEILKQRKLDNGVNTHHGQ